MEGFTLAVLIFPSVVCKGWLGGGLAGVCIDWWGPGLPCQTRGFPRIPHILVARARVIMMTDECLCLGKNERQGIYIISFLE